MQIIMTYMFFRLKTFVGTCVARRLRGGAAHESFDNSLCKQRSYRLDMLIPGQSLASLYRADNEVQRARVLSRVQWV